MCFQQGYRNSVYGLEANKHLICSPNYKNMLNKRNIPDNC